MAIFSNLDGTMKNEFTLGKKGARITYANTELTVRNFNSTGYIPIAAGEPTKPEHVVTLDYYTTTIGVSQILSGTTIPENDLGKNGNIYIQVDSNNILKIFFKDQDVWKTFL